MLQKKIISFILLIFLSFEIVTPNQVVFSIPAFNTPYKIFTNNKLPPTGIGNHNEEILILLNKANY